MAKSKNALGTGLSDVRGLFGVVAELKKITWPSRKETLDLTAAVVIISLIIAGFVGIIDFSLTRLLEFVVAKV